MRAASSFRTLQAASQTFRGDASVWRSNPRSAATASRAVSALPTLLDWCMPLVAPRGAVLALKGSRVRDEVREARPALSAWRCAEPVVTELGSGLEEHPTFAVRIAWADPDSVSWPASRQASGMRPRQRRR